MIKTLTQTLNDRLSHLFEADLSLERLLWQTGKSREELLEIILADDEIDACRQDIESALKAKPYRIWGDELAEDDVNRLLGAIRPHMQTLIASAVLARFSGYAIIEYVYKQDDKGFWVIDKMLPKDGETHRFSITRDGALLFNDGIKPIPINTQIKCLCLTSRATPARPTGEMMVIKAYPAVMLRNKGFSYAGQFITRYAQPFIIGKQVGGYAATNFVKAIFNLSGGGAAVLGGDDQLEIKQLTATGDAFTTIERLCNARIQKLLLGRVKISELTVGSRAATETDDKARMDRMSGYADLLAIGVQHAIDAIIAVNSEYGTPIHAPNGAIFEFAEPVVSDLNRASRDKTYAKMGLVFTADYYKDMLGLEEHHFTLANDQPAIDQNPQTKADTKLSQELSQNSEQNADGEFMLSKQRPTTLTPVFELSDSEDYNDFQNKLAALSAFDLDNEALITDLAHQSADEYIKGLNADLTHDHTDQGDANGN